MTSHLLLALLGLSALAVCFGVRTLALCAGADVYVQTAIRADIVRQIPNNRIQDILDYHSSVEQAADRKTDHACGQANYRGAALVEAPAPTETPSHSTESRRVARAAIDDVRRRIAIAAARKAQ